MDDIKEIWKNAVIKSVQDVLAQKGLDIAVANNIIVETPPDAAMGDIAFPMFAFAKPLHMGPPQIANTVAEQLNRQNDKPDGSIKVMGPYINVFLSRTPIIKAALDVVKQGSQYGTSNYLAGKKIMIEFSGPNTNKPLHLGHLRNDILGESYSRIVKASGADLKKVNIVNDRGVHICKSMLAYTVYGNGKTPESENIKSDHFVGNYYVMFNELKEADPEAEKKAQDMLVKWENGDADVKALWTTMTKWAVDGIAATYKRTNISFDEYHYESNVYLDGKDEVLKGLDAGVFFKSDDGAIRIDASEIGLDNKVLLRKDGTSVYITQDIGLAIKRYKNWPFNKLIYVVASEQQHHFKMLFYILQKLGYAWAKNLYHLAYGLVNLPEGRMKTREGTVVDADNLLDSLKTLALEEIISKGRNDALANPEETAEKIALGAVHYYLIQATPSKDMIFNPKESLSFNGNTGPYIQYMGARISSILRKHAKGESNAKNGIVKHELLNTETEWELVRLITSYPKIVENAASEYNPSFIAAHLYAIAGSFAKFYHDYPILNCDDADLSASRLALAESVLVVIKNALALLCIPFLDEM